MPTRALRSPSRPPPLAPLAVAALTACGDKDGDSGGPVAGGGSGAPRLEIVSPRSGDFYDQGDTVLLDADARGADGAVVEPGDLRWSLVDGDWSASGDNLDVTDVPPGVWTLQADANVEGQPVQATAELIIYAAGR